MKFGLTKMANVITNKTGRFGLVLKKHSPDILIGAGIVLGGCAIVAACKATLKADEILDEHKESIDKIAEARETKPEEYTEEDAKIDTRKVYLRTGVKLAKGYAPAILFAGTATASILSAHGIMKKRNAAITAAFNAMSASFRKYRDRVKEELGDATDEHFLYGKKEEVVEKTEINDKGKEKTVKHNEIIFEEGGGCSPYAKFFDKFNPNWQVSPEYNLLFLRSQERFANDLFTARGHLFLNEVYDMLGIERTSAGAVVGWVKGAGDDYVDFGLYDGNNMATRRFVNGLEDQAVLLDFNVDGVIFDKI